MEGELVGSLLEKGPLGLFVLIAAGFLFYLLRKDKSDKTERAETRDEQKVERKEVREHQEKTFNRIADATDKSTTEITRALGELTKEFQQHDAKMEANHAQCMELRKDVQAKI